MEAPASGRGTVVVMTLPTSMETTEIDRREQKSA
jgi:hypothetical protein